MGKNELPIGQSRRISIKKKKMISSFLNIYQTLGAGSPAPCLPLNAWVRVTGIQRE